MSRFRLRSPSKTGPILPGERDGKTEGAGLGGRDGEPFGRDVAVFVQDNERRGLRDRRLRLENLGAFPLYPGSKAHAHGVSDAGEDDAAKRLELGRRLFHRRHVDETDPPVRHDILPVDLPQTSSEDMSVGKRQVGQDFRPVSLGKPVLLQHRFGLLICGFFGVRSPQRVQVGRHCCPGVEGEFERLASEATPHDIEEKFHIGDPVGEDPDREGEFAGIPEIDQAAHDRAHQRDGPVAENGVFPFVRSGEESDDDLCEALRRSGGEDVVGVRDLLGGIVLAAVAGNKIHEQDIVFSPEPFGQPVDPPEDVGGTLGVHVDESGPHGQGIGGDGQEKLGFSGAGGSENQEMTGDIRFRQPALLESLPVPAQEKKPPRHRKGRSISRQGIVGVDPARGDRQPKGEGLALEKVVRKRDGSQKKGKIGGGRKQKSRSRQREKTDEPGGPVAQSPEDFGGKGAEILVVPCEDLTVPGLLHQWPPPWQVSPPPSPGKESGTP